MRRCLRRNPSVGESVAAHAARAARLHQAIREVLTLAIEHRGSSISDYVDADGQRGDFQVLHHVYGREGEACVNVRRGDQGRSWSAQRGTHFCPRESATMR